MTRPLIHLVTGSTGAGKTTYALKLAVEIGAVRFSIDDWMVSLFGPDQPATLDFAWMMARVNRCEAQMWALILQTAALGVPCILDVGLTKAQHRTKFADLARAAGLRVQLHHVDVPVEERWRRVERRNAEKGETFRLEVTRPMFNFIERMWEPPTEAEMRALNGARVGA